MKAQGGNTDAFTRSRFGSPKPDYSNSPLSFHYLARIGNIKQLEFDSQHGQKLFPLRNASREMKGPPGLIPQSPGLSGDDVVY
jgi:hypothetical protein